LKFDVLTGLTSGQRLLLFGRCRGLIGDVVKAGGRPPVIDTYQSIALVVGLMRKNLTQEFAGEIFGVSQPTVSRRWDLLRPVIRRAVAGFIPDPRSVLRGGTALVDGTICPTWDWKHIPDLFSGKVEFAGMNVQVAASLDGRIAAIGPLAVHGARHDAHAFEASGLKAKLAGIETAADLGYIGVEGITIVPYKKPVGIDLLDSRTESNTLLSKIRAAVERAIAHVKTWRMLSQDGGRYRAPIEKYEEMLQAVTGLIFLSAYE
jgi:transposase